MKNTKVRINTPVAGLADSTYDLEDFSFNPGQIVELHPKLAEAWIASGTAEAVSATSNEKVAAKEERETTSVEAPEKAVLPEAAPRKVGRPPKVQY